MLRKFMIYVHHIQWNEKLGIIFPSFFIQLSLGHALNLNSLLQIVSIHVHDILG